MDTKNDGHLFVSYKKIDKAAFKEIYNEFYKSVFHHLFFSCKDYELCRDLTQETFFKLWEQRDKIKDTGTLLPYLLKIARNLITDFYRHQKVELKYNHHKVEREPMEASVESQLNASMLEEKIRQIVNKHLGFKTQSIFIMSRFEGKTNDEISDILGLSKKTIENQLYIATSLLRQKLKHFL